MILQQRVDEYNLKERANNGYRFERETKGVYGIPKSG